MKPNRLTFGTYSNKAANRADDHLFRYAAEIRGDVALIVNYFGVTLLLFHESAFIRENELDHVVGRRTWVIIPV